MSRRGNCVPGKIVAQEGAAKRAPTIVDEAERHSGLLDEWAGSTPVERLLKQAASNRCRLGACQAHAAIQPCQASNRKKLNGNDRIQSSTDSTRGSTQASSLFNPPLRIRARISDRGNHPAGL